MAILNYTTTIAAHRTVGEIQTLLAKKGARSISVGYDDTGQPTALAFELRTPAGTAAYRLPCRAEAVERLLRTEAPRYRTPAHARNVAWRIVKDWVEAQLAIIEAGMVEMPEVFLPYMLVGEGMTMFERAKAQGLLTMKGSE